MEPRFIDCDRHTLFLMPPSIEDWLPEDHLARFVVDIVGLTYPGYKMRMLAGGRMLIPRP